MRMQTFKQVTTTVGVFLAIGAAALAPTNANAVIGVTVLEQARGGGKTRGVAERLWDIEQIHQLKARYFRFLDTRQWRNIRELFTDDFVWYETAGDGKKPRWASADAFISWVSGAYDPDRVLSVHQGKMPEIELTSDITARGIWEMSDWVDYPQKHAHFGWGYYYDEYAKGADGKWRISSTHLVRLRDDQVPPLKEANTEYPRGLAPWWPFKR
jgi:hypothetical protein